MNSLNHQFDLNNVGGVRIDDDDEFYTYDTRFIIIKIDRQYVDMGISKVSSRDNFEFCTENLGKISRRNLLLFFKFENIIYYVNLMNLLTILLDHDVLCKL